MLQLNHLKKSYDKKKVLSDVDYVFEEGLYPVLGANGSGKTTLFGCICDDIFPDGGSVKTTAKKKVSYAAKESVLPEYISGYEFVKSICGMQKRAQDPKVYLEAAGILPEFQKLLIKEYDFENKKRLQLAAFLIQQPYVMLFDEPFDGCDEMFIEAFLEVLREYEEKHIILISTGNLEIAKQIRPDIFLLNNGELNKLSKKLLEVTEIKQAIADILGEEENGAD